jgi:hypothetical protein
LRSRGVRVWPDKWNNACCDVIGACDVLEQEFSAFARIIISARNCVGPEISTAIDHFVTVAGIDSVALGHALAVSQLHTAMVASCAGMGATTMELNVATFEDRVLVNSGAIHGRNLGFVADERLTSEIRFVEPRKLFAENSRKILHVHRCVCIAACASSVKISKNQT